MTHWSSLGVSGRGGGIRTRDPLHPMQVRYQAALRPDRRVLILHQKFRFGNIGKKLPHFFAGVLNFTSSNTRVKNESMTMVLFEFGLAYRS